MALMSDAYEVTDDQRMVRCVHADDAPHPYLASAAWPTLPGQRCLAVAAWPALPGRCCLANAAWPLLPGQR